MTIHTPLLTDFYQLTMAYGYWRLHRAEKEAVFQLTFRKNPFQGSYTIACGLQTIINYLMHYQFTQEDIHYLASLKLPDGRPIFPEDFLAYLLKLNLTLDINAIPEGNVIFPNEPLLQVKGPLIQCQLIETALLNFVNFPSLVATRAAQIYQVANGDSVVEFGLRRAQGPDGGLTASRAAYIGGCESVSNVLAGKLFDIPVSGTISHSWIMSYSKELTAFQEFVDAVDLPVLLVDTYDSMIGTKNAILVGQQLRQKGRKLLAVRLDSGDLNELSKNTRKLLDQAGFNDTKIMVSGDLTLDKIAKLKTENAPIDIWGIGTKLVTAYEQPSLDAIYKLTAIKEDNHSWSYKMKYSDTPHKMTHPGIHQVRRYYQRQKFIKDVIYDIEGGISQKAPARTDYYQDLLVPIFSQGKLVYQSPNVHQIRHFCIEQTEIFLKKVKKDYPVEIDSFLEKMMKKLLKEKH